MSTATALHRPRPGRPPECPRKVLVRVIELRRLGLSYMAICTVLNAEGVLTPAGRPVWHKSYVDRLLHTQYAIKVSEEIGQAIHSHAGP